MQPLPAVLWAPLKPCSAADFAAGAVGPYRLGPRVRCSPEGEVHLALADGQEEVVELERFTRAAPCADDVEWMSDLAELTSVRHERVLPVLGAGIEARVPYLVRRHRLGCTLAELLAGGALEPAVAGAVLFAVADALAFLAEQGTRPGVCALGGVQAEDVHLGYGGAVALLASGARRLRVGEGDAPEADRRSLGPLAERLEGGPGSLSRVVQGAQGYPELLRALRRRHGSALARADLEISTCLWRRVPEDILRARRYFGLDAAA